MGFRVNVRVPAASLVSDGLTGPCRSCHPSGSPLIERESHRLLRVAGRFPRAKPVQAVSCNGNRRTQWLAPENSSAQLDNIPQTARSASSPAQQRAPFAQKQNTQEPIQEPIVA